MSITQAREDIINRLACVRDVGVAVKGLATRSNVVGDQKGVEKGDNGVLLLYWESDNPAAPNRTDKSAQDAIRNWVIDGELINLDGEAGLETFISTLYRLTINFRPTGHGNLYATGMSFLERNRSHWRFRYEFACSVLLFGEPQVEAGDVGANLQNIFISPATLRDRYGVNEGTGDLPEPAT